ncbi:hypothetical protein [Pseudomonas anguilliseptica]|uniref:hypothetical protein n=1 Tax=Pseudomonas anguilliseptica TaxID=53406 RepID=UPI0022AEB00E|nr:hypothetical protein [Pseudomonas anguilliseptica]MCZ4321445.1 hypothetical protein [Pseudomonas anguilliseptica]
MNQAEFLQQHAPDGNLTAEQAAQLLELSEEGDTGAASADLENGGEPDTTAATEAKPTGEQVADDVSKTSDAELNADNAVILAKDGKHTISYDKLVQAREAEKTWRDTATAAQQELADLKAQAQQRADAGIAPTKVDNQVAAAEAAIDAGVDPEIFGDFSEEAIAKGVQHLIAKSVPALVDAQVKQALQPHQQKQEADLHSSHFDSIYEKHPDLDSMLDSKELEEWLVSQPSYVRVGFETTMKTGSAPEVIEFFDTFKAATGKTQTAPAPSAESVKEAAKQAIAQAKPVVPASLSDFPGGKAGPATGNEALANLGANEMAEALMDKTPEQIEAFLNRSV